MAVRDIVLYLGNEAALRQVSRRVERLVQDLKDTMGHHPNSIGLTAPQINVHRRVILVRLGGRRDDDEGPDPPIALINPQTGRRYGRGGAALRSGLRRV